MWDPDPLGLVSLLEEILEIYSFSLILRILAVERPCEDIIRGQPSANQEKRYHQ